MATRTRTGGGGGTKARAAGKPPGGRSGVRAGEGAKTAARAFQGAHAPQPPKRAKPAPAKRSLGTSPPEEASAARAAPSTRSPRAPRSPLPAGLLALLEELPPDVAADVLRQASRAVAASGGAKPRLVVNVAPAPDGVSETRRRAFGLMRGRIRVPADFDETPADLIAAMEGGGAAGQDGS